jgi:hypothetical protein
VGLAAMGLASMGLALLVGGGSGTPTATLLSVSASQVVSKGLAAAERETSVHVHGQGKQGSESVSQTADALVSSGRQVNAEGADQADLVLVGGTVYLKANRPALVAYGFPSSLGPSLANKWISVPRSNRAYAAFSSGMNISQTLDEIHLSGSLSLLSTKTIDGQRVVGVRGLANPTTGFPAHSSWDLYFAATGRGLPVEGVLSSGSAHDVVTFSNWGEKLTIKAPSGAIPIASIGG